MCDIGCILIQFSIWQHFILESDTIVIASLSKMNGMLPFSGGLISYHFREQSILRCQYFIYFRGFNCIDHGVYCGGRSQREPCYLCGCLSSSECMIKHRYFYAIHHLGNMIYFICVPYYQRRTSILLWIKSLTYFATNNDVMAESQIELLQ